MIRHYMGWIAVFLLVLLSCAAIFGPSLIVHDFNTQNISERLQNPSFSHLFGTDELGRDILVRILFGARISIGIGVLTALLSLTLGTFIGAVAGYYGKWSDLVLLKVADVVSTVPAILVATLLTLVFGRTFIGILISISSFAWILQMRIVRAQVHVIKNEPYIEAARALGAGDLRILISHILPQLQGTLIISLGVLIPTNILTESFLSFLGIGLQPPLASWGSLAYEGFRAFSSYPHLAVYPGVTLFLSLLAMNIVADWLHWRLGKQNGEVPHF